MNARSALWRGMAALAAVGILGALAACAPRAGSTGGDPIDDDVVVDSEVEAAWLDAGRMIGIITYGSSSCLPIATEVTASGNTITVELVDPEGAACTRDYVPRVSTIPVPEGVDSARDVEVVVTGGYRGDADLDGVAGLAGVGSEPDYLPSAGWADDELAVLLTWGSSTCVPVVEKVEATGPSEWTVTFVTPPADQACTADMAPRGTVISGPELHEDDGAHLVLVGTDFDNVQVPIIG